MKAGRFGLCRQGKRVGCGVTTVRTPAPADEPAMCGRFTLISDRRAVARLLALDDVPELFPRYNVAPAQPVLAIRQGAGGREAVSLRWGLVPSWSKDGKAPLINASSETVADKPAFRSAFRKRRCLVPADGFYEWQLLPGRKQPFLFRRHDGGPFAIAGLWESWQGPDARPLETCALLTTEANAVVRPVHDRMPVLVSPSDFDRWLAPDATLADLLPLLRPAADDALTALAVAAQTEEHVNVGLPADPVTPAGGALLVLPSQRPGRNAKVLTVEG
jgi:putative SOS response-associated peptidase YedK